MRFINIKLISFFIKKLSQLSEHKFHTLNTKMDRWQLLGHSTIITSSLFTGTAFYIGLISNPSKWSISENRAMLAGWKHNYAHIHMEPTLALVSGVSGLLLAYKTGNREWLVGAGLILSNIPYTLICIIKLNNKLVATPNEDADDKHIRPSLKRWNNLHNVRTLLGAAAIGAYVWALSKY